MNIALIAAVAPATNGVMNFINNLTTIVIAGMGLLALLKIAPLIMKGRITQIIGAIAVVAIILYFANNPGSFTSIGNFVSNMFK